MKEDLNTSEGLRLANVLRGDSADLSKLEAFGSQKTKCYNVTGCCSCDPIHPLLEMSRGRRIVTRSATAIAGTLWASRVRGVCATQLLSAQQSGSPQREGPEDLTFRLTHGWTTWCNSNSCNCNTSLSASPPFPLHMGEAACTWGFLPAEAAPYLRHSNIVLSRSTWPNKRCTQ